MAGAMRRNGRIESGLVYGCLLENKTVQFQTLMGMLIDADDMNNDVTTRRRKEGTAVRHPLDLVDTNMNLYPDSFYKTETSDRQGYKTQSLSRKGSLGSTVSRKSSSASLRSNATITSGGSQVRKNSGNFDGARYRRNSTGVRRISSCQPAFMSEYYKSLDLLEELSTSSSSDDESPLPNKRASSREIVEEYLSKHSDEVASDTDEGFSSREATDVKRQNAQDDKRCSKKFSLEKKRFTDHQKSKGVKELLGDINSKAGNKRTQRANSLQNNPRKNHTFQRQLLHKHHSQLRHNNNDDGNVSDSSISNDSAHCSTHSLSSNSTCSNFSRLKYERHSVPLNFIPGMKHPPTTRSRNKSLPVTLHFEKKAFFCYKGITCRILHDASRPYKALAHAGCMALVIPAPSEHKCNE